MQGLAEAAVYQQGKIGARKTKLTINPVDTFNTTVTPKSWFEPKNVWRDQ
jgi:hypothetical protein